MIKHLGLLSAVILFLGLLYVVRKWPYGVNHTFSQHVARHKSAIVYYAVLFCLVLPLLLLFFFGWFIPYFDMTVWFKVCISVSALLQLLCTFVPEVGGIKSTIHRGLAFLSADFLLPATILISLNDNISPIGKAIAAFAAIIMTSVIIVMLTNKAQHKYLLLLQSLYFGVFFLAFLIPAYTS